MSKLARSFSIQYMAVVLCAGVVAPVDGQLFGRPRQLGSPLSRRVGPGVPSVGPARVVRGPGFTICAWQSKCGRIRGHGSG